MATTIWTLVGSIISEYIRTKGILDNSTATHQKASKEKCVCSINQNSEIT
jgi:hypothetical protein